MQLQLNQDATRCDKDRVDNEIATVIHLIEKSSMSPAVKGSPTPIKLGSTWPGDFLLLGLQEFML